MSLSLPTGINQEDLDFGALQACMVGDVAFFTKGNIFDPESLFEDTTVFMDNLIDYFVQLGELAEKPGKSESKTTKLKTRNFQIPGKRSSTVDLTLNGLSAKQKDYFESALFSGEEISILFLPRDYEDKAVGPESIDMVVFAGMRWTVDWSADADDLWTVVISTEFAGSTSGKIYPYKVPVPVLPEEE